MTFDQIETALGQRLEAILGAIPVAWPNRDFNPEGNVPYVEFRHAPNTVADETSGGNQSQIGLVLLTVVTMRGSFSGPANVLAQTIATGLPKGLRLASGAGFVLLNAPTSPRTGFSDGVYWRQPLTVSYMTEGT
jgi:hypothetical protein